MTRVNHIDKIDFKKQNFHKRFLIASLVLIILLVIIIIVLVILYILSIRPKQICTLPINNSSFRGLYIHSSVASDAIPCASVSNNIISVKGGNAIDGAIAGLLCSCSVNLHSCGIGGGSFLLFYNKTEKKVYAFDIREMAPKLATKDMFANNVSSTIGGKSIAVTGLVAGYYEIHKKFGKVDWKTLVEPTIDILEKGFYVSKSMESGIDFFFKNTNPPEFKELRDVLTNSKTGKPKRFGDIIKLPKLANTMRTLSAEPFAMKNGSLVDDMMAEMTAEGSIITKDDLLAYEMKVREPISVHLVDNSTLYTLPPPSSGVLVAFSLNVLAATNDSMYSHYNSMTLNRCFVIENSPHFFKDIHSKFFSPNNNNINTENSKRKYEQNSKVCSDKSRGRHYVDIQRRNNCQFFRLQKCFTDGIPKEAVHTGSLMISNPEKSGMPNSKMSSINTRYRNQSRLMNYLSAPEINQYRLWDLLISTLHINDYNFDSSFLDSCENTGLFFHRLVETMKFSFAKRSALGDIDFVNNTELLKNLTSESYSKWIMSLITDDKTHPVKYYNPSFEMKEDHGTSHFSLVSPEGDAVSVTSTINYYFGSLIMGNKTGIVYNDEMDDFSSPDKPNIYNLPPSPSNFIIPYKRPMSSMSPIIIVDKEGNVDLVLGASGGSKILSATTQVTILAKLLKKTIKEAIDIPRVHHQLIPNEVVTEMNFPDYLVESLKKRGHIVKKDPDFAVCQGVMKSSNPAYSWQCNADFRKMGLCDGF